MQSTGRTLPVAWIAAVVIAQDILQPSMSAVCPVGLSPTTFVRGQSCYEFNGVQVSWENARANCHQRNGRLVSVTDADLQLWLSKNAAELRPERRGVWLGLNDRSKAGDFVWDDYGTTNADHRLPYSNWAAGYPSQGILSGDCVAMFRDDDWKWQLKPCSSSFYKYNYICEYRGVAVSVTTTTLFSLPAVTSATGVTLSVRPSTSEAGQSVATEYPQTAMLSSAAYGNLDDAGIAAHRNDVTVPLSISVAVIVVAVALVVTAIAIRRWHTRSRLAKSTSVAWTRVDGTDTIIVGNPMYGDSEQFTTGTASLTHGSSNGGMSGRPVSNIYAEMSCAEQLENTKKKDGAAEGWASDGDLGPTYAEPYAQVPFAAADAEPAAQYHQYTYIEPSVTSLMPQRSSLLPCDDAAVAGSKKAPSAVDQSQQPFRAQQLQGARSIQDGYEPFVSQWSPYENVLKPDA